MSDVRPIHLTCPRHCPPVLRREVEALGLPILSEDPAGIRTEGGWREIMRLNLQLRTAMRVLWILKECEVWNPDELYEETRSLPWEDWINPDGYFTVQVSVDTPTVDHTNFPALRVKDAIVDRFREKTGRRPDTGPDQARGAAVFVYWKGRDCSICLDTSGEPLSHRGYRLRPGEAPLRENLAASLILASEWDRQSAFLSPMGGSGTLAIEAAMMALNRAPGLLRKGFAFMHLKSYDARLWNKLLEEARAAIRPALSAPIILSDISPDAIGHARANARAAGVEAHIQFVTCDFRESPVPPGPGVVFLNPPYGERLGSHREDNRSRGGRLPEQFTNQPYDSGHRPSGPVPSRGRDLRDPRFGVRDNFPRPDYRDPRSDFGNPRVGGGRDPGADPYRRDLRDPRNRDEPDPRFDEQGNFIRDRFERSNPDETAALEKLYADIGLWLKQACRGKLAYVFSASPKLTRRIRLNPRARFDFFNTQIPCQLSEFELFAEPPARPAQPEAPEATEAP